MQFVEIPRKRLTELERIERAHASYLGAMRQMRVLAETVKNSYMAEGYTDGYRDALKEFGEMVVQEARDADRAD